MYGIQGVLYISRLVFVACLTGCLWQIYTVNYAVERNIVYYYRNMKTRVLLYCFPLRWSEASRGTGHHVWDWVG